MNIESLLTGLIPDPNDCRTKADQLRASNPTLSPEDLARKAVKQAKTLLAAGGAISGMVSNPLAMFPVALTEMSFVLNREAKLAGVVAALLEPEVLKDPDAFSADILAVLFPASVSQALGQFAVRAGQQTSKVLIRKYISKDLLKAILRFAARYLGLKLTQRALITKFIPIVGGVIGASWNWVEVQSVGKRAIDYYKERVISAPHGDSAEGPKNT